MIIFQTITIDDLTPHTDIYLQNPKLHLRIFDNSMTILPLENAQKRNTITTEYTVMMHPLCENFLHHITKWLGDKPLTAFLNEVLHTEIKRDGQLTIVKTARDSRYIRSPFAMKKSSKAQPLQSQLTLAAILYNKSKK